MMCCHIERKGLCLGQAHWRRCPMLIGGAVCSQWSGHEE